MVEEFSNSADEKLTREKYINPALRKRRWNPKYVKEEVNSIKSNFVIRRFVFFDGHPEKGVDRFVRASIDFLFNLIYNFRIFYNCF